VSTTVAVCTGLGAAGMFAAGTTLQYKAARPWDPGSTATSLSVLRSTIRHVLSSRTWIAGTALLAVGLGLHAFALHEGPIILVQPILVLGLLFALPASRYAGGPPIRASDLRWAALLVASLAAFLAAVSPASQPARGIDPGPASIAVALSLLGTGGSLVAARRCSARTASTLLGGGAGVALAGSAALIKVCTEILTRSVGSLFVSWQLYALIVVGLTGVLLSQIAYRAGPMTASLPAIHSVDPVVSVVIGWGVFDERFRVGAAAVTVEAVTLVLALSAIFTLSRRSAEDWQAVADPALGSMPPGL
jgi:hypothetical protein